MVDKEVILNQLGLTKYTDLDNKNIIDAIGVGMRYHAQNNHQNEEDEFDASSIKDMETGECILRGIEVKVSRSDFRAGFACSGCNYHYLLTPLRLLAPWEVPSGVGLIEYNPYKFSCVFEEEGTVKPFLFNGLRVVKRAVFRRVPRFQVDGVIANIADRHLKPHLKGVFKEFNGKLPSISRPL